MNSKELLAGMIDFHVHPGPDAHSRVADAYEIAFLANRFEMKGIVLKHHDTSTSHIADILSKQFPKLNIVGGLCLEGVTGGINPRAVEVAIRSGAKIIWMPSLDAYNNSILQNE